MPFPAGRAPKDVSTNFGKLIKKIVTDKASKSLTNVMRKIGDAADKYVPIDTYDLIQSRRIVVQQQPYGWKATLGYGYDHSGAYARILHENENVGWKPRSPGDAGKRGAGVNSNAKPGWIILGAVEVEGLKVFAEGMKV